MSFFSDIQTPVLAAKTVIFSATELAFNAVRLNVWLVALTVILP